MTDHALATARHNNGLSEWEKLRWTDRRWRRANVIANAWASELAYSDDDDVQEAFEQFETPCHPVHIPGGVDGYLVGGRDRLMLLCRGSEMTKEDWRTNGQLRKIPLDYAPGHGHQGFVTGGNAMAAVAVDQVDNWGIDIEKIGEIHSTGHSQGGAIAQTVLEKLLHHSELNMRRSQFMCTSFASPRVYDKEADPQVRHLRVLHERDLVPLGPPLFLGYRHKGEPHILLDNRTHLFNPLPADIVKQRLKTIAKLIASRALFNVAGYVLIARALWKGAKSHGMGNKYLPILRELQ